MIQIYRDDLSPTIAAHYDLTKIENLVVQTALGSLITNNSVLHKFLSLK